MVNSVGFNSELIQIADTVAREKGVSRNLIIEALEQAIQSASKKKYGHENIISAKIKNTLKCFSKITKYFRLLLHK